MPGASAPSAPDTDPGQGPSPWLVANLVGQLAFGLLAMTICIPSMQEWARIFNTSQAQVQLSFSGFVVTYGLLQLVYGPLSDRLGRKRVLMVGLVLALLGSIAAALATDISALVAARVLQGAGSAAGTVVGRAMVQDLFRGPQRTRIMAYVGMAMGLCPPTATIIGGQLHVQLGWQANFVVIAVGAVLLLVAAWRGLPDRVEAAQDPDLAQPGGADGRTARVAPGWLRAMGQSYARLAREPSFALYVCILGLSTGCFYAFLGGAPLVLGGYGVGPDGIGFYIMVIPMSYIVGNYLTTRVVQRLGDQRMMVIGQSSTIAGIVLMLVLALAGLKTPLALALPLMLLGLGHGMLVPPTLAGTVGLLPALAGSAAAVVGLMQQLFGGLAGYGVGLVSHHNAVNLGLVMLAFSSGAALCLVALHRRWRHAAQTACRARF